MTQKQIEVADIEGKRRETGIYKNNPAVPEDDETTEEACNSGKKQLRKFPSRAEAQRINRRRRK